MMMRRQCLHALLCRCAAAWIVPVILLPVALVMVGCPEQRPNETENDVEVVEHSLSGIVLTTNGVPISIDTGQVQMNAQLEGKIIVSSFPEDVDENDNENDDPDLPEPEDDTVTLVFVVIPIADEPTQPSRHFVVSVKEKDEDQDQNWIELTRQQGYPSRYQYQVTPRVHNGTRPMPGDYLLVAVKIGPDMQLPEPPGELVILAKSVGGLKFVD